MNEKFDSSSQKKDLPWSLRNQLRTSKAGIIKSKSTNQGQYGYWVIDAILGAVLIGASSALALTLINSTNDGVSTLTRRSKVGKSMAARMDEIRVEAFQLYCLSGYGCDTGTISNKIEYDRPAIQSHCNANTLGQSLLERLKSKNLDADYNLQVYDSSSTAILVSSQMTARENGLDVILTESGSNTIAASTIVPNALGWCN